MSETQSVPEPVPAAEAAGGSFFGNLVGLYVEPHTTFATILRTPGRWWLPLLAATAIHLAFCMVWLSKMDPVQHARTMIEESSFTKNLPPEQKEAQIEGRARSTKFAAPVVSLLAPLIGAAVFGAFFLFVYRFFFSGEVTFKQSLAVNTWTGLVLATISIPLMLAVYAAKGDWNIDPTVVLQANLSLLVAKDQVSPVLYGLAESIDLFSFWTMFLLASGYAVLIRKPTSAALWGMFVPWGVVVLIKLGFLAVWG